MDRYPSPGESSYTPDQPLTPTNVHDHVNYMHTLQPRAAGHDQSMRKLYDYVEGQADGLQDEPTGVSTFFDKEVLDEGQLAEAIVAAAQQVQAAVLDRGRGHFGQKGQYFWDGAEDIQEQQKRLLSKLWAQAQLAGVTEDTWFSQVMTYKPLDKFEEL